MPDDTRQALHLEQLESSAWLDDDSSLDDDVHWGEDPAAAAERRENERGVNYFNQPIN
jgi:hypothetical protein